MLWLPFRTVQWFIRPSTPADQASPASELAMLLLLLLVHHPNPDPQELNPYKLALNDMQVGAAGGCCCSCSCCWLSDMTYDM
jgi:hypothetical protein